MLKVEVADSPSKQEQGLMFRHDLPEDEGMLFIFNKPQTLRFWGENTFIPLDIAFVSDDEKIVKISKIDTLSRRAIASPPNCIAAIETNAGFFKKHNIKEGAKIDVQRDKNGSHSIFFGS